MPRDFEIDEPIRGPNAFTTSGGASIPHEDVEAMKRRLKQVVDQYGPPKCMVIMPNGEVYSGTIGEIYRIIRRAAFQASPLFKDPWGR